MKEKPVLLNPEEPITAVVQTFHVAEADYQEVLSLLKQHTESFARMQPGFVSANCFVTSDKQQLVNYLQWNSESAWTAYRNRVEEEQPENTARLLQQEAHYLVLHREFTLTPA